MKSIITLSLGQAGSFTCQHFYNILNQSQKSQFFYETKQANEPRCVFVNLRQDVGPTLWSITELESEEQEILCKQQQQLKPEENQTEEQFDEIQEIRSPVPKTLSDYHKRMNEQDVDADVKLFEEWNRNKESRFVTEARSSYKISGQFYTEFQELDHQVVELHQSLPNYNQLYRSFYSQTELEDVTDSIQKQLERSDRTDGLNLFQNSQAHFGRMGTEVVEYYGQECPKQPILLFDVSPTYQSKFPLQLQLNSLLQRMDVDSAHVAYFNFGQLEQNLYEMTSRIGLLVSGMMECSQQRSLDFIQRGLIPSPLQKYVQSSYYLHQSTELYKDYGGQTLKNKLIEAKSSVAGVVGECFNQKETDIQKMLVCQEHLEFVKSLQTLQKTKLSLPEFEQKQNEDYRQLLEQEKQHKRIIQLQSGQVKLSKTFPHCFANNLGYRTDANLRFEALNSPVVRNFAYSLKQQINSRKGTTRYRKYFDQVDRESSEVTEQLQSMFEAYQKWEGDTCKQGEWSQEDE